VVPAAVLIDWIWGDEPPAAAANALQRLVSRLRKLLPAGVVHGHPDGYRLQLDPDDVDAVRFERLLRQADGAGREPNGRDRLQLLREAVGLWRGTALQDVGLPDSPACDAAITRLEGLRLGALEDRFDAELDAGAGAELISELTDLAAAYPLRERPTIALMRALVATGRNNEALTVFERLREALADALGADPSPEVSALHVAILRGEVGRPERQRRSNLRADITSYVGKQADVQAVQALLAGHRLVTLIGPGGSGKTRLATEVGRGLLGGRPDGPWLVELAPVGPTSDVAQATLVALGLRDAVLGDQQEADPTGRVIAAIRGRDALIILDNCEHVIESAATFVHRLLGECERLRVLATSREPLGITGETLWRVEPLTVPAADAEPAEIERSPAVRLLRDRAGIGGTAIPTDAAGSAVAARLCRALDGIPLAIELAAARIRTMPPAQLADRLDDRFRLLTGGSRTALPHHRTLRAVVDWSWSLLTEPERAVLRRLAVFSGGADLDAAETVCVASDVDRDLVLDLLTSLVDKSLLVVTAAAGAQRYRMLSTIKEYAFDRLTEAGEADAARQAHLAHFTQLVETAGPHLLRAEQLAWLAVLAADHDNITAAMRGVLEAGDAAGAMRLAGAAGWYWWLSGRRSEGLELMVAATELPGEVEPDDRAVTHGMVAMYVTSGQGDENVGAEWIRQAYRYARESRNPHPLLGFVEAMESLLHGLDAALVAFGKLLDSPDPWVRATARWQTCKMRVLLGRGDQGVEAELEQALAEFTAIGERFGMSLALSELAGWQAMRGDFAGACARYDRAVEVLAELGAVEDVIEVLTQQAKTYWLNDDHDAGAAAIRTAERWAAGVTWPYALVAIALAKAELARWAGNRAQARRQLDRGMALLGEVAALPHLRSLVHGLNGYLTDDPAEARAQRLAAWRAASQVGAPVIGARILVGVADTAARAGDYQSAARLLGAAGAVRGMPDRSDPDEARIERETRRHLGEQRFAEVTQQGRQPDVSELVEQILAD
jgi:predicted ATPase/DNA-binding SARP family transcriptional activator